MYALSLISKQLQMPSVTPETEIISVVTSNHNVSKFVPHDGKHISSDWAVRGVDLFWEKSHSEIWQWDKDSVTAFGQLVDKIYDISSRIITFVFQSTQSFWPVQRQDVHN